MNGQIVHEVNEIVSTSHSNSNILHFFFPFFEYSTCSYGYILNIENVQKKYTVFQTIS